MTTDSAEETPKARVRRILIDRLKDAGVERPKPMKVSTLEAMFDKLVDRLTYMNPENLETLAETILDCAAQNGRVLPPEIVIRQWAESLQAMPREKARIVTSWLSSVEGPKAIKDDIEVELYDFLVREQVPPRPYEARQIRQEAERRRRDMALITERRAKGVASATEIKHQDDFLRARDKVRAIIEAGNVVA